MIEIDGKFLEGGGQILRTAVALSVVTKKPCHIFNIRNKRPKPGLMTQHLLTIQALAKLCNGKLEGDELGSEEIWFSPGQTQQKDIALKINGASSITLILQALIIPCLKNSGPTKISFQGGATDTFFSPSIDYFRYVFLKILEKITSQKVADVEIRQRGFYPEGGALVEVKIYSTELKKIGLIQRGNLKQIFIISGASEHLRKNKVAERQSSGAKEILSSQLKLPIKERVEYYQTLCPGSQINIIAECENTNLGVDNLGQLGKSAEEIGQTTAKNFLREGRSQACLDRNLADQILPFMALAKGSSEVSVCEITNHCKTNIWVIEKFIHGKFEIKKEPNLKIIWHPFS